MSDVKPAAAIPRIFSWHLQISDKRICLFWWRLDRFIIAKYLIALMAYTSKLQKITQKFFLNSIHKPPAVIRFAPISMPSL